MDYGIEWGEVREAGSNGVSTVSFLRLNTLHQVMGRKLRGEWTRKTKASGSSTYSASHLTGRICCNDKKDPVQESILSGKAAQKEREECGAVGESLVTTMPSSTRQNDLSESYSLDRSVGLHSHHTHHRALAPWNLGVPSKDVPSIRPHDGHSRSLLFHPT